MCVYFGLNWLRLSPAEMAPFFTGSNRETIEQPMDVVEDPFRKQVEYEEHEFANRFNKLMEALRQFSATYNSGHTINVKEVKAVRKAWRELERSEWFRPYKGE
jgi:hypothetical protein